MKKGKHRPHEMAKIRMRRNIRGFVAGYYDSDILIELIFLRKCSSLREYVLNGETNNENSVCLFCDRFTFLFLPGA